MMGSGQRQLRNPALAMDRHMSVSLTAMISLGVKMAPALREPFPKCVDLHEVFPISLRTPAKSYELADVEHFAAFCNVRKQDIYEWMLPVESKTERIFGRWNALDRRQDSITERVILGLERTFPTFKGPPGINPIIY
jgi:hypothetical protein